MPLVVVGINRKVEYEFVRNMKAESVVVVVVACMQLRVMKSEKMNENDHEYSTAEQKSKRDK